MNKSVRIILSKSYSKLKASFIDLMPIILVVIFFQYAVLQTPLPNLGNTLLGLLLVIIGLALFIEGLEIGLFPVGENLSQMLI